MRTLEMAPDGPILLELTNQSSRSVRARWMAPPRPNGNISYTLYHKSIGNTYSHSFSLFHTHTPHTHSFSHTQVIHSFTYLHIYIFRKQIFRVPYSAFTFVSFFSYPIITQTSKTKLKSITQMFSGHVVLEAKWTQKLEVDSEEMNRPMLSKLQEKYL